MNNFKIRAARASDWERFYPFLAHDKPIDSLENAFKRFQKKLESESTGVFVAELEGQIVGVASDHARQVHFMVKNGARILDKRTQTNLVLDTRGQSRISKTRYWQSAF